MQKSPFNNYTPKIPTGCNGLIKGRWVHSRDLNLLPIRIFRPLLAYETHGESVMVVPTAQHFDVELTRLMKMLNIELATHGILLYCYDEHVYYFACM